MKFPRLRRRSTTPPEPVDYGPPAGFDDGMWATLWAEPDPKNGDGSEHAESEDDQGPGTSDPSVLERADIEEV